MAKKDADKASNALEEMKSALLAYREAGKPVGLTGDDWGVGAVPNCQRGKGGTGMKGLGGGRWLGKEEGDGEGERGEGERGRERRGRERVSE